MSLKFNDCYVSDFETLSTLGRSIVLSFASIHVDFTRNDPEYWDMNKMRQRALSLKFDVKGQGKNGAGRFSNPETIEWWKNQGKSAQAVLMPSKRDIDYREIHSRFRNYFDSTTNHPEDGQTWFFYRGAMDTAILDDIIVHDLKEKPFYNHWWFMDIRTAIRFMLHQRSDRIELPVEGIYKVGGAVYHNAVDDCIVDAKRMKFLLDNLELLD